MKRLLPLVLALALVAGCAVESPRPPRSQLQKRQMQTRIFEVASERLVMKAMINVLQDEGFMIDLANLELGVLKADKEVSVEDPNERMFAVLFAGDNARWKQNQRIECTANVSRYGKRRIKVRVVFFSKILDNHGGVMEVRHIESQRFYQDFFAKVDKSIFLAKENL